MEIIVVQMFFLIFSSVCFLWHYFRRYLWKPVGLSWRSKPFLKAVSQAQTRFEWMRTQTTSSRKITAGCFFVSVNNNVKICCSAAATLSLLDIIGEAVGIPALPVFEHWVALRCLCSTRGVRCCHEVWFVMFSLQWTPWRSLFILRTALLNRPLAFKTRILYYCSSHGLKTQKFPECVCCKNRPVLGDPTITGHQIHLFTPCTKMCSRKTLKWPFVLRSQVAVLYKNENVASASLQSAEQTGNQ